MLQKAVEEIKKSPSNPLDAGIQGLTYKQVKSHLDEGQASFDNFEIYIKLVGQRTDENTQTLRGLPGLFEYFDLVVLNDNKQVFFIDNPSKLPPTLDLAHEMEKSHVILTPKVKNEAFIISHCKLFHSLCYLKDAVHGASKGVWTGLKRRTRIPIETYFLDNNGSSLKAMIAQMCN